ncbi:MAG: RNA polymerase sigma-70 factor [Flavobacteriales bacterium]|nr:RNA polymerase sigma-70 factor [Flavobacteriales bacterium]
MDFARIAAGDHGAFELVFREHYRPLCAFARQYVRDGASAEELVQDLFYRLWQDRERTSITTSLKSYLFTAVRNRCLNAVKQQGRLRAITEHDDHAVETADPLEGMERGARIQAAIEALPEERRKIFLLSRHDGLKYQEIADRLGLSVKTVENQIGRALKTLREDLADLLPLLIVAASLWTWFRSLGG